MKKIYNALKRSLYNVSHMESLIKEQLCIANHEDMALNKEKSGVSDQLVNGKKVIVSLTTHGTRINSVYLTIESLLNQTMNPACIVLWLDSSFKSMQLPILLQKQCARGLKIQYCQDLKSYTKLVHSLLSFPEDILITVDDDILYPNNLVENLVNSYMREKKSIHFARGHRIRVNNDGSIMPYISWAKEDASGSSLYNFPTGVGGVLYPPGCFHEDVCKQDIFLSLCPYADDVWFKAMSLLKNVNCTFVETGKRVSLENSNINSLVKINVALKKNDEQIQKVFEKYSVSKFLIR